MLKKPQVCLGDSWVNKGKKKNEHSIYYAKRKSRCLEYSLVNMLVPRAKRFL